METSYNKPEMCPICSKGYWSLSREKHYQQNHPDLQPEPQRNGLKQELQSIKKQHKYKIACWPWGEKKTSTKESKETEEKRKDPSTGKLNGSTVSIKVEVPLPISLNNPPSKNDGWVQVLVRYEPGNNLQW